MDSYYIWFKALHIAMMVTWFAGLFYLPRLFIYHAQTQDADSRSRFSGMERKLYVIMTIGAVLTFCFGLILASINTASLASAWFSAKMIFVLGLVIYHYRCWLWISRLSATNSRQPTKWLRWFNEFPVLFLFVIVILAVVKPI